jgi:hypothetical protein
MRSRLLVSISIGVLLFSFSSIGLTQPTDTPRPIPFARHTFAALAAGVRVEDVTLNGPATYYSSNVRWSNIVLKAVGVGQRLLDVGLPSGERPETRSLADGVPSSARPERYTPAWFLPAYAIATGLMLREALEGCAHASAF